MYYKAIFDKTGYTETVCIITGEGFKEYSRLCGNTPLTINFDEKIIIVHEK